MSEGMFNMAQVLTFDELIADFRVESFEQQAKPLLESLLDAEIEIDFTFERREATPSSGFMGAFRQDISRYPVMESAAELRFAMGLELLWMRLQELRRRAGFSQEEIERYPDASDTRCLTCAPGDQLNCFGCSPETCSRVDRELLRQATQDLILARNEMVARNLYLVFPLLSRYRHVHVPAEDLVQDANEALFRAVEGFDFTRGVRFKTYAGYWVNQAFLNAIYNQSRTVRVPAYIQKAMKKLRAAEQEVEGGLFNIDALAERTGVDRKLVAQAVDRNRFTLSLDGHFSSGCDEEGSAPMSQLLEADDEGLTPDFGEAEALAGHLEDAVARLSAREQEVVRMRFGLGGRGIATLAEVGRKLGISLERVRQIQRAALEKLRSGDTGSKLKQYA
jgi:RNA polymerase nonessential primary-like sigma factor